MAKCLMLAMFFVRARGAGETMVNRVYHRDRGFEAVERKLSGCGAWIEQVAG